MISLPLEEKTGGYCWGAIGLRKELDARLGSGDFRGVLERAAELVPPYGPASDDAAWGAVLACRAAGALHDWGKAVAWAERGLALNPDPEARGWLDLLLGTAAMYLGDPFRAERHLNRFLTVAPTLPGLERLLPDGLFNYGHLQRFLRRDPEAEARSFLAAAKVYGERGRYSQVLLCHAEAGWSLLMAVRPEDALPELETAAAGLGQHGDPTLQTYVEICWAFYYRQIGAVARSQEICAELAARPDLTAGQRADVAWLAGSNASTLGDWTAAAGWAERAYEEALQDWWPLQLTRIEELRSALPVRQVGR
jgi:tetratricopeptide (TPR) repeat protein